VGPANRDFGVTDTSVIIVVADGLGVGALDEAIARGDVPALARMADEGGRHTVSTVFPSVTGVAYVPLLTGRFPAGVGIPGLRWYDRRRGLPWWLGHSRSYVGLQLRRIDADLAREAHTLAELVPGSLGAQSMVRRGFAPGARLDRGLRVAAQAISAHLAGDPARWATMEQAMAGRFVDRVRRERPRCAFAAFIAGDKALHQSGVRSEGARRSLMLVDEVVGRLRRDAEADGRWRHLHLWVASDHGHAPVSRRLDLARALRAEGLRVRAHPWTVPDRSDVAVMVSGNSMAHVYVDLASRERRPWPELQDRWQPRLAAMLDHPAIDLVATRVADDTVEVTRRGVGSASITARGGRLWYRPGDGDPLELGCVDGVGTTEAHERSMDGAYPDSLVQLAALTLAERSGDVVVSAAPDWDLRAAWEPVRHVSSHGGLHRDHMAVPLLLDRPPTGTPRRTADVFPSALQVLGVPEPPGLEGVSFASTHR